MAIFEEVKKRVACGLCNKTIKKDEVLVSIPEYKIGERVIIAADDSVHMECVDKLALIVERGLKAVYNKKEKVEQPDMSGQPE